MIFLNGFSPPFIPIGMTFALLFNAKYATPFFSFSPFSIPLRVPSGNNPIHSPFFKYFILVYNRILSAIHPYEEWVYGN